MKSCSCQILGFLNFFVDTDLRYVSDLLCIDYLENRVSIIYISWEKELDETLKKLQDLHKSGIIAYAKICALEKPIDNTIPRIHIILSLHIQKSILQI